MRGQPGFIQLSHCILDVTTAEKLDDASSILVDVSITDSPCDSKMILEILPTYGCWKTYANSNYKTIS